MHSPVSNARHPQADFLRRCLVWLLIALCMAGQGTASAAPASRPAAASYRIIQLSSNPYTDARMKARGQVAFNVGADGKTGVRFHDGRRYLDFGTLGGSSAFVAALNDKGQIAFNIMRDGHSRAMFHDGRRVVDLGTLGGPDATAADLNGAGQIAGTSSVAGGDAPVHPFRWSSATGMLDLGPAGQGNAVVTGLNAAGQVAGRAIFAGAAGPDNHGFFWSPRTGILDIGALGDFSVPAMMNDRGVVIGYGGTGPLRIRVHAGFAELLAAVDGALYRAKANGRDRIELASVQPAG